MFNNTAMKKRCGCRIYLFFTSQLKTLSLLHRTHRFAILAMSLSSIFDIQQPTDFLRSALNMLTEYEQAKEDNDRPKMVISFPSLIYSTLPELTNHPP